MAYPMVHLCIAYNILKSTSQIKNPCDFMLGSLAPDSIHFRDSYNSAMKQISHLCVGDEKWGEITNNKEWLLNVLGFLEGNKHVENIDYIYGYCTHLLVDIQTNIKIWTPFKLTNKNDLNKGVGNIYNQELYNIDYALYFQNSQHNTIWHILKNGIAYDIPNVVVGEEVNKMKDSILHNQFINREASDLSLNKYVTLTTILEFISTESKYIKNILY